MQISEFIDWSPTRQILDEMHDNIGGKGQEKLKEYGSLTPSLECYLPPEARISIWRSSREALLHWIDREYLKVNVRKFIGKIGNGFDYWFTFIIDPGVEPTNNRAENALRPHFVLREIFGTLRNSKGTVIRELIMISPATWGQRGLDRLQMLTERRISQTHKRYYSNDICVSRLADLLTRTEKFILYCA